MARIDKSSIFLVIIILLLFSVMGLLTTQNRNISKLLEYEREPQAGDKMHIFSERDVNGEEITIRHSNAVLFFFNTSCDACRKNISRWQEFYENNQSKKIKIIAISADPPIATKKYITQHNLAMPVVSDPEHRLLWEYRVKEVPVAVLINRDGRLVFYQRPKQTSQDSLNEIQKFVDDLIEKAA